MKQIILSLLTVLCFFTKSNAQCNFNDSLVNDYAQLISINVNDTVYHSQMISGSCGGQTTTILFKKTGSALDSSLNFGLYKDGLFVMNISFANGITVASSVIMSLNPNDTVDLVVKATVGTNAQINQTIQCEMTVILNDSSNVTQILGPLTGPVVTVYGCNLHISKDTTVQNSMITPGTGVVLASFNLTVNGNTSGCTFSTIYSVLNNIGSCPNGHITNVKFMKATQQLGSTLPTLGTNSAIVFNDVLSQGTTNYKIIGDVDPNAPDMTTIQMDFNLVTNVPAGATITQDSLGQIMTIDNPVITVCTTTVVEDPTPIYIYPGSLSTLGAFAIDNNCPFKMDSVKVEMVGTGNPNKCTNLKVQRKNSTLQFGNTIGSASYVNLFSNISNLVNNQYDTFMVFTNLATNAVVGQNYQPYITIYGHVVGSTVTQSFVLQNMGTKIVATPTSSSSLEVNTVEVSVSPNPATDYMQINGLTEPTEIVIINSVGQTVLEKSVFMNEKIDMSVLPDGVYIVSIKNVPTRFKVMKL